MNVRLKSAVTLLAAACAMAVASGASAQSAGQWTAKVGVGKITPKVDSGDVSAPALPGSKVAVSSDTEPVFIFAYGITDNVSAELDLGVPYKHKLYGAGALAGTGQLGTVEALPPAAFLQYRFFEPTAMVR
ncbi:MAG TPA: OmpW family outer membrane protein, partial [Telluria sp.]|nr:OmpW family outer membrane protein [Telluria sp.]